MLDGMNARGCVKGADTMRESICQLAHERDYARALRRQTEIALAREEAKPAPDPAHIAELSEEIEKCAGYLKRVEAEYDLALRVMA
jgi:hypothetical protein